MSAQTWLDDTGKKEVEEAIVKAETDTCCEFVCAISSRSAAYESGTRWWSLVGAVLGLLLVATLAHMREPVGDWAHLNTTPFVPSLFGLISCSLVLGIIAQRWPTLLFMFVNKALRDQAVERAASYLFGKHKVSYTEDRVGVLIYLSLAERQLVVLADRAVSQKLGPEGLAELTKIGTDQLSQGDRASALTSVITSAVERLKDDFPGHSDDTDELKNEVLLIHPFP